MTMVGNGDCIHIQSLTRGSEKKREIFIRVDENVIMVEKGQFVGTSEVLHIPYCPRDCATSSCDIEGSFPDIDIPKTRRFH